MLDLESRKVEISFCIVSMNRLDHIKKTLPINLRENTSLRSEFVLLDFSSSDGLAEWVTDSLSKYLLNEKLRFFRVSGYEHFLRSYSRNVCINLSRGKYVCNLDADNYAGLNFDEELLSIFSEKKSRLITVVGPKDTMGKFAMPKRSFDEVRGFDEQIKNYGFEDHDLQNRLLKNGLEKYRIVSNDYNKFISHDDDLRLDNERLKKNIKDVYLHSISSTVVNFIFLYKDGKSIIVSMTDAYNHDTDDYRTSSNYADIDIYRTPYKIEYHQNDKYEFKSGSCKQSGEHSEYSGPIISLKNTDKINEVVKLLTENENRNYLIENLSSDDTVNPMGYGKLRGVYHVNH